MSQTRIPVVTPLLKKRLEKFEAELPPFAAFWDRVYVYCITEKVEQLVDKGIASSMTTTKGGLYVPADVDRVVNAQVGFIVSMGPKAIEQCYSAGIELGQIIVTNRLSRWQKTYWANGREHEVLLVTAGELTGGYDMQTKLLSGECWYEMDDHGRVMFNPGDGPRPAVDAPQIDYGV